MLKRIPNGCRDSLCPDGYACSMLYLQEQQRTFLGQLGCSGVRAQLLEHSSCIHLMLFFSLGARSTINSQIVPPMGPPNERQIFPLMSNPKAPGYPQVPWLFCVFTFESLLRHYSGIKPLQWNMALFPQVACVTQRGSPYMDVIYALLTHAPLVGY